LGISFGSINTGLPKDIVKKIMEAERIPIKNMENRKSKISDKKKLVSELGKLVEDIRGFLAQNINARSFRELKATTGNDAIAVTVDKNVARTGNTSIEVVQLAKKSSAMSSGFADPEKSYVGVGYITYTLPNGDSKEIYIDSDDASLKGIARVINGDTENGLHANVVNDGSGSETPWRLILSMDQTGDQNKAEFPYFYFIDGDEDFYIEYERPAQDAKVKIDGFEVEVPKNKVKDLIPGVTLDLKKAKPGEEINIDVEEDVEAATGKIGDLVDKLNAVFKFIKDQNNLDEKTDTSRTLGGDIILQTIESRLRAAIFQDVQTKAGPRRLADLGISFTREGMLKYDKDKFTNMVKNNSDVVGQILSGYYLPEGGKSRGFIDNLNEAVDKALRYPDGIISSRKKSLQNKIDQIDRRIVQRERMLKQKEKNLKNKFARLEGTISRIKSQGAGLAGMTGGGASPVQQLG
jgi:flagellar hook-associated protein 2